MIMDVIPNSWGTCPLNVSIIRPIFSFCQSVPVLQQNPCHENRLCVWYPLSPFLTSCLTLLSNRFALFRQLCFVYNHPSVCSFVLLRIAPANRGLEPNLWLSSRRLVPLATLHSSCSGNTYLRLCKTVAVMKPDHRKKKKTKVTGQPLRHLGAPSGPAVGKRSKGTHTLKE
jgi:hypothetical protein